MNRIKDNTMNFIVEEATKLFLDKSIVSVTMSDIAKRVGIGEATLYRYFQKKQNIVMQASVKLSKSVVETYFNLNTDTSGFTQLTSFYKAYEDIFSNHPDYFKFINELDAYIITENVSDKSEYETNINVYKEIFENAYKKGLSDNSVKKIEDISTFYYSTTHALLNLCKFLSTKQAIEQSKDVKSSDEIKTLISIILAALKGE